LKFRRTKTNDNEQNTNWQKAWELTFCAHLKSQKG
jgi:hypothetical protein